MQHMLDSELSTQLDLSTAGEIMHKCGVRQKRFSHHSHLKTHMLIHTGGRPHKCDICEELFT